MSSPLLFSPDQLILSEEEGHYPEVISWVLNRWYMSTAWWRNTLFIVDSLSPSLTLSLSSNSSRSPLLLISRPLLCSQSPTLSLISFDYEQLLIATEYHFCPIFRGNDLLVQQHSNSPSLQTQPVFKKGWPHNLQSISKFSSGLLVPIYSNSI